MLSRSTGRAGRSKRYGPLRWTVSTRSRKAKELPVNSANPVVCRSLCFPLTSRANRNSPMASAYRAALLAFTLSGGVLGIAQQTPVNVVTPVGTADASCGQCHAKILHSYLATPMANASGLAGERLKTGAFEHKLSGVKYRLSLQGS